jgi:1-acyl-sn-glycerol-3-phosphate acyltransferase
MGFIKAFCILVAFLLSGFFGFCVAVPGYLVSLLFPRMRYALNGFFIQPFSYFVRAFVPLKLKILNEERAYRYRPAIFLGNHQTGLDFALISQACRGAFVIVAKKELFRIPIFGWFFFLAGNLLIDRSNSKSAMATLRSIKEILISNRLNLAMFPEGTRSKTGKMLPFKKGAFILAKELGLPIVPVVCSPLQGIGIWENYELQGGEVMLSILEPISAETVKNTDIAQLIELTRTAMEAEFERFKG